MKMHRFRWQQRAMKAALSANGQGRSVMRVLICYATTDGQTRKIAEYVGDLVRKKGHDVDMFDANMVEGLEISRFDAAIFAGSVHMGRYQAALVHQIRRWCQALKVLPVAFVSVSLSAGSKDPHVRAEVDECAQHMLNEAGVKPVVIFHVAGAIRFSQYDFFRRWIMRLAAKQMEGSVVPGEDQEYTDWDAVTRFVDEFLAKLRS
jgi:menaquinone-dependent protoporphyrinogen oxidase